MIRLPAPAKINLFLEITGKRADGYHTISTLFQTISLADELSFAPRPELSMTCSSLQLPADDSNLVLRAARALQALLKEKRGARIHLVKRVPMGAGLGGGSSDAAATLRGLLKLWKRQIGESALRRLAVSLGADVPFFLKGGLCQAEGIGEKLRPLKPLPKTWLVLIYPGFGVSTKEAYGKVKLPFRDPPPHPAFGHLLPKGKRLTSLKAVGPLPLGEGARRAGEGRPEVLFNRFEDLVFPDHPQLPQLKKRLLEAGATAALMSGSGSSVFGLVPSQATGRRILNALRPSNPQSWLVHT